MEHRESLEPSIKEMTKPQHVCDRIEAVKGGIREKLFEANAILLEIRNRPKEDVSRERYVLEKATLKLIAFYEIELEQERIDLEIARRNAELVRIGVGLPGREHTTASNDDKYLVDSNQAVA